MVPTLLGALRSNTADLHARAEAAFVLGAPDVTRREYTAVLARMLPFYLGRGGRARALDGRARPVRPRPPGPAQGPAPRA